MPTKKQRRRREKGRRHEWEEVYVDEEGREIPPDEVDELIAANGKPKRDTRRAPTSRRASSARTVEPPSWRRVGRRALIFAPLMFGVIWLLDPGQSFAVRAFSTLQLMVLFVPFSYLVDTFAYRMYRKRVEGETAARS